MSDCNRRDFLGIVAGGAAMSLAAGFTGLNPISALGKMNSTKARGKMNVLFIAVDDLRPQLACYGKKHIISPNIDRLAAEGLLFERAYCQQAVCAPSRMSLLSGLRPDSTGVYDLNTPLRKALPDVLTLPQHFRQNGYETVSIGKIYHHPEDDLIGWSTHPYRSKGEWVGRGYLLEKNQAIARQRTKGQGPPFEAADVPDSAYPDGKNTDFAIKQLHRLKDRPFFLAMGFHKPHLPFNAPKKYWDIYRPEKIKLADNPFIPKNATEYSLTNFGELRNYFGMPKEGKVPDNQARRLIHGYYACVTYIDLLIGRLLGELERLKLRDKTVIILWCDHGWKLGEHASWCKHTNFEIDTHVPMIISVPGMKTAGRRSDALTEYVDIYPTLCELCGLQVPEHLEGTSFVPLLENPSRQWKSAVFSQYPRSGGIMGYTMRTELYRYTEWKERKSGKVRARELYDHRTDPDENVNIVNNRKHAETVRQLAVIMKAGWRGALPDK